MPPNNEQTEGSLLREDMIATFSTVEGEKVLKWLMLQCNFDSTVQTFDPYEAMFSEGRRSLVALILQTMQKSTLSDPQGLTEELAAARFQYTEQGDADDA